MKQETLQKWVEEISISSFKKPFLHKAVFNSRLRTTGGRYHLKTHDLDFNSKILTELGKETFIGIIKHELCHYHLHLEGKGYQHVDVDFKQLLLEVGGLRFTPPLEVRKEEVFRWEYVCLGCKMMIYRQRRFNVEKYICSKCHNHFKLNERVSMETKGMV